VKITQTLYSKYPQDQVQAFSTVTGPQGLNENRL